MTRLVVCIALVACHHAGTGGGGSTRAATGPDVPLVVQPGPGTAVITLASNVPTIVLDGPFLVTTINPGSTMYLAISPTHACDDPKLTWFEYSGSGVAVGKGQTLCARSRAEWPVTNGFSGTTGTLPP